jgi:uncharacterized protein (DUF58 family)
VSSALWDASLLSRIAHLHLVARRAVDGWRHGGHGSRRVSANIEFVDHQEYVPGDPIKHVDWKVAARTDRLVIRRHIAETVVPITIVLDASADLGTTNGPPDLVQSKIGAAITMAATLAVFFRHRGDPVGLEVIAGSGVSERSIPPGPRSLPAVIRSLAEVEPHGTAQLEQAFARIGERLKRRSVVVVVSDLMEDPAVWGPSVGALVQRGVDCRVVHLYDPAEWTIDVPGPVLLFSPEGGEPAPVDPAASRTAMAEVVDEYVAEVQAALGHHRCQHHLVPIDARLDTVLAAVIGGRS